MRSCFNPPNELTLLHCCITYLAFSHSESTFLPSFMKLLSWFAFRNSSYNNDPDFTGSDSCSDFIKDGDSEPSDGGSYYSDDSTKVSSIVQGIFSLDSVLHTYPVEVFHFVVFIIRIKSGEWAFLIFPCPEGLVELLQARRHSLYAFGLVLLKLH